MSDARPRYSGGANIALKVPPAEFDATERFYVETLGLPVVARRADSVAVAFGPNTLHLDRVDGASRAEVWLEIATDDVASASSDLEAHDVVRCDHVEPLPPDYPGFWISSPAGVVHLVVNAELATAG
jgi:catechol 2,3-dioxygenase-like lactoylglutathione lyase family enzyme